MMSPMKWGTIAEMVGILEDSGSAVSPMNLEIASRSNVKANSMTDKEAENAHIIVERPCP
jgi:hypothetical protein